MAEPGTLFLILFGCIFASSVVYVLLAAIQVCKQKSRPKTNKTFAPEITILKPLCGLDYQLYENLCSYCEQDYSSNYQIVFGLKDCSDPALSVLEQVKSEFPDHDIYVVIDERVSGTNYKVSNLKHMYHHAKYDIVICADSDVRVNRDYLSSVVAPFNDPIVGGVTCAYTASSHPDFASTLGAMYINSWFLPSILIHNAFQNFRGCFGQTMAVRRQLLDEVGGFDSLNSVLADDYVLAELIRKRGFKVVLSDYFVDNVVRENGIAGLLHHELRWARTILSIEPFGYFFSVLTFTIPISLLTAVINWSITGSVLVSSMPVLAACALRMALNCQVRSKFKLTAQNAIWLIPLRDCLNFFVWCTSFFGRRVRWREEEFDIRNDGKLELTEQQR